MRIPLFDIDGTLFKTANPIHFDAFTYMFKKIYGVDANQREIQPEGMLDQKIIIDVLKLHGFSEDEVKEKLSFAEKEMNDYVNQNISDASFVPLPGVLNLLENLKKNKIHIGILSGNLESIAWAKLENAGIKNLFDFGAFGSEAFEKVDLIEIARKKAEEKFTESIERNSLVIIGDTPKDIKCARDGGIKVIAVATGIYSFEELEKLNPDLLVKTLEEKEKIMNFLDN